jgi:hypothetical protein
VENTIIYKIRKSTKQQKSRKHKIKIYKMIIKNKISKVLSFYISRKK